MMRRTWRVGLVGLATAALLSGGALAVAAPVMQAPAGAQLAQELSLARDDERVSHDLYTLFAETYKQDRPFGRIAQAEQRHFDRVGDLLKAYEVADPAAGKQAGQYANPEAQKRYDTWKEQGLKSVQEAYKVGVDLETKDIARLKRAIEQTEETDVDLVWTQLLRGSEHHLAAYTAATNGELNQRGGPGWGGGHHGADRMEGRGPMEGEAPMNGQGPNCPR